MHKLLMLCALLCAALPAGAQPAPGRPVDGVVVRRGWPHSPLDARRVRTLGVLPAMDTLSLGYRIVPADAAPALDLAFRWTPGAWGVLDGRRVPYERLPEGVRLVAFVLTADVMQQGKRVAGFSFEVDSTRLAAGDVLQLSPRTTYDRLFDGLNADAARRLVRAGFTLHNLRLVRAAFAVYGPHRRTSRRAAAGTHRTTVVLDAAVEAAWHLAWLFEDARVGAPILRRDRDEDDDEGDDDEQLLPHALAGLATVAALAYAGGTAGLYGAEGAPLGLAAGRVGRASGVLLQAGVNLGVLGARDEPERLQARLVAFRTGRRIPVGPFLAVGLDAREAVACPSAASCTATDGIALRGLVAAGLAVRAGRLVLLGGADLTRGHGELGAVVRMR